MELEMTGWRGAAEVVVKSQSILPLREMSGSVAIYVAAVAHFYHLILWGCPWSGQLPGTIWMFRSLQNLPHSSLESRPCASAKQHSGAGPGGWAMGEQA